MRFLGLFGLGLLLAGCGGGGGGGGVTPPSPTSRSAILSGAQETVPVVSTASGYGSITIDPTTRAVSGSVNFLGIASPTAAHIHNAALGSDGGIVVGLTLGTNTATVPAGTVLTETQYTDFLAGRLYFNVHSSANPTGELRGQIGVEVHSANLTAAQELNATNTSTATGPALVVADPATRAVSGGATFSGIAGTVTAAHIHTGAAGVNGAIVVGLTLGAGSAAIPAGTVLTPEQYQSLQDGNLYFNVHTSDYAGGEIRGQIGRVVRVATLDGAAEVPSVTTTATGNAIVAVHPQTRAISGVSNFSGLTATSAHIHTGAAGVNGGIVVGLTLGTGSATVPAGATLLEEQFASLVAGDLYVNIHSAANPAGEIRGQLVTP
jgi:hypothetical protein